MSVGWFTAERRPVIGYKDHTNTLTSNFNFLNSLKPSKRVDVDSFVTTERRAVIGYKDLTNTVTSNCNFLNQFEPQVNGLMTDGRTDINMVWGLFFQLLNLLYKWRKTKEKAQPTEESSRRFLVKTIR